MELKQGQRFKLPQISKISLKVESSGKDVRTLRSALILLSSGAFGKHPPLGVIFPGNPTLFDKSVELVESSSPEYNIDLSAIQGKADRFIIALWIPEEVRIRAKNLSSFEELSVSVQGEQGKLIARYCIDPKSINLESAILHSEIYYKSGWRFKADGSGFVGGIITLASRLNIAPDLAKKMDYTSAGGTANIQSLDIGEGIKKLYLPSDWPGGSVSKIPGGLVPAVGRVIVEQGNGELATGTAFAVSPGGHMITCAHVIEGSSRVSVYFNAEQKLRKARIVYSNEDLDLALIWLEDTWGLEQWLKLSSTDNPPELGEEIGLLGYPLGQIGLEINFSKGVINSIRNQGGIKILQIDAGAAPGSSGGPLFRWSDGTVIGVLGGGLRASEVSMHVNFAVAIDELHKLL